MRPRAYLGRRFPGTARASLPLVPRKVFGAVRRAPGWVGSKLMLEPLTGSVTVVRTIHPARSLANR